MKSTIQRENAPTKGEALLVKNIARSALESFQEVFQRLQGHILLSHLHPMKR